MRSNDKYFLLLLAAMVGAMSSSSFGQSSEASPVQVVCCAQTSSAHEGVYASAYGRTVCMVIDDLEPVAGIVLAGRNVGGKGDYDELANIVGSCSRMLRSYRHTLHEGAYAETKQHSPQQQKTAASASRRRFNKPMNK
jgi:hypothetical protein